MLGKIKGRPLHGFRIRGYMVFVVKSSQHGGTSAYRKSTGTICVLAPPGMSNHQAALEAVAALEAGKFHRREP
jgi:hypothetical protein